MVGRADGLTLMETADPLLLLIAVVYLSTAIVFENISVLLSGAWGAWGPGGEGLWGLVLGGQSNKGPRGVGCSPLAAAVTSGL